jgi:integrase
MLEDYYKKNRPNITLSSIKTYVATLKSISKRLNIKIQSPDDIINNVDDIIKYYDDISYTMRKSHYAAMISFIDNGSDKTKPILDKLRKILMQDKKQYDAYLEGQDKTEKQKENWIDWNDVVERYKAFEKEVIPLWKLSKKEMNKNNFNKLKMFVLLSCYILIPPRRALDFAAFKIRNINESTDNYMKKRDFIFNTYKTAKTYGMNKVPINYKLYSIIKKWTEINQSDYLITAANNDTKGISVSQLTAMLNNFFDKKISVNMLRHSFLTHMYKDLPDLKDMKDTAGAMGHSLTQALDYIKKD